MNDSLIGSQWRRSRRWKNWLSPGRKWSHRYIKQNEDEEAAEALNRQMPLDERVGGKKRRRKEKKDRQELNEEAFGIHKWPARLKQKEKRRRRNRDDPECRLPEKSKRRRKGAGEEVPSRGRFVWVLKKKKKMKSDQTPQRVSQKKKQKQRPS